MARSQMPDKKLRKVRQEQAAEQASLPKFVPRKRKLHSRGTLQAVYGDQQKVWRIVYVANGLWQLQQFNSPEGASSGWGTREQCWWRDYGRPTDHETAHSQLKQRDNMQQASA